MKLSPESVIRLEASKLAPRWAEAFDLSEDEAREHLMAGLTCVWDAMASAHGFAITGAHRRDTTVITSVRIV